MSRTDKGDTTVTRVRVVLFDLDDTLFAHVMAAKRGFTRHLASFDGALADADPDEEYARWRALEAEHYPRYLSGELDLLGQRRVRTRAFVDTYGLTLDTDVDADAWFDRYYRLYEEHWVLHEDALACLESLAPRPLGIITNGDLDAQTRKLMRVGLHDRVDHIVTSGAFGSAKPGAAIFHHACELFGVPPAEACYVGDRLSTDALGAADAGMLGIWLDRDAAATDAERTAAAAAGVPIIHSLEALEPLLSERH